MYQIHLHILLVARAHEQNRPNSFLQTFNTLDVCFKHTMSFFGFDTQNSTCEISTSLGEVMINKYMYKRK